ncbi:hypothetical protein LTR53_006854 [Teratosphaeriaceae sp. CCFEE 6253]|nr:hypothetical protein LTR53_006854 [Teratosphaeriaceae sp. CCFEE 6253]
MELCDHHRGSGTDGPHSESRRLLEKSVKRLWLEEYLMLGVLALFTADCWTILETAKNGSNYLYLNTPEVAANLSPELRRQTVYGSKMTLILEYFTLTIIWSVKLILCLMFHRLTSGLPVLNRLVKVIAIYCVLAYFLIIVLFSTTWCRPFQGYWAVPVRHSQCATYYHHMIFATAFNISADLVLLMIPLKIIPGLQMPLRRKILLICVLGLGVFNILAAILNRYYNFAHPESTEYLKWYVGEVGTAIYVVNVPACWPLLRKLFPWATRSGTSQQASGTRLHSYNVRSGPPARKSVHSTPGMSESEENLASDDFYAKSAAQGWDPGAGAQNSADAKFGGLGGEGPAASGHAIVKTIEVSQQSREAAYWEHAR